MKICWDTLEKLRFNKRTGRWYKKTSPYVYRDKCGVCGEPFLLCVHNIKRNNKSYCSKECKKIGHIGFRHSEKSKEKIGYHSRRRDISYEKKEIFKNKENHPRWKGGYNINIPLFDTYAHQISFAEEVRRNQEDKNILEVKCTYCGKWYVPTRVEVQHRIRSLNGDRIGESKLYCSEGCKQYCPVFYKKLYQVGHPHLDNIERPYQAEWSKMVRERDEYQCVICGSTEDVVAHHIDPVKTHPHLQADIDNGITLCEKCHNERGYVGECSTGNLAKKVCI